ncbi:MAG: MerR family transcriptional regulator [Bryobacterales bacterium]|nr:MerR family transcriptional regulator [Bryobacterales bacterium]
MVIDQNNPQFVNSDVMRATGLTMATIQTWVNRGLITPASEKNPGHGQRRFYSLKNIIWLTVMARVTEWGLPVSLAAEIADGFERMFQADVLDTAKWLMNERTGEFPEYESFWVAIGKDKDGKFYTTQRPWTIRKKDGTAEQKAKMRAHKGETIMLIIDLMGVIHPVLLEVERLLQDQSAQSE